MTPLLIAGPHVELLQHHPLPVPCLPDAHPSFHLFVCIPTPSPLRHPPAYYFRTFSLCKQPCWPDGLGLSAEGYAAAVLRLHPHLPTHNAAPWWCRHASSWRSPCSSGFLAGPDQPALLWHFDSHAAVRAARDTLPLATCACPWGLSGGPLALPLSDRIIIRVDRVCERTLRGNSRRAREVRNSTAAKTGQPLRKAAVERCALAAIWIRSTGSALQPTVLNPKLYQTKVAAADAATQVGGRSPPLRGRPLPACQNGHPGQTCAVGGGSSPAARRGNRGSG